MSNRIGRLKFIFWFVASILSFGILLGIVAIFTNTAIEVGRTHPMSQALCLILAAVMILGAAVCRLHDLGWPGWPGWAVVLLFVPLVDIIALFVLLLAPGQHRSNRFGGSSIFLQRFRKMA